MKNQLQKFKRGLTVFAVSAPAALMSLPSHAAIDVTSTTTAITDAQTAVLAVIGALLAMSVAIFGLAKVYSSLSVALVLK